MHAWQHSSLGRGAWTASSPHHRPQRRKQPEVGQWRRNTEKRLYQTWLKVRPIRSNKTINYSKSVLDHQCNALTWSFMHYSLKPTY